MKHVSTVELLVAPYFENEVPPQNKINSWIYSAKSLPNDGVFVVVAQARNLKKTKELVDASLRPSLGARCILISHLRMQTLPKLLAKLDFSIDEKTKWYDFGMHKKACPPSLAKHIIEKVFGLNVKSQHIKSKSTVPEQYITDSLPGLKMTRYLRKVNRLRKLL
ncbi:MAG: hypothetical protein HYW05_02495 [Candidatus Diapherotrites archaeon]|nr:hypothetical protein [Candidatus Diapherotrites archaeon]